TAVFSIGAMLGPIAGPSLGGWLTEHFTWRSIFYANIPFGVAAMAGLLWALPRGLPTRSRGFDIIGFVLLGLAVGLLQLVLDRGHSAAWFESKAIVSGTVLAVLCFYLFVIHMTTTSQPFLNPRLFANANLMAAILLA